MNAPLRHVIQRPVDVATIVHQAKKCAAAWGFGTRAQWQIAIAVSEAATNILKHGVVGEIVLYRLSQPSGLAFEAIDQGKGFDDIELSRRDGVSGGRAWAEAERLDQREGLGAGLGAIERMMDRVSIHNRPEGGALLIGHKYLTTPPTA